MLCLLLLLSLVYNSNEIDIEILKNSPTSLVLEDETVCCVVRRAERIPDVFADFHVSKQNKKSLFHTTRNEIKQ